MKLKSVTKYHGGDKYVFTGGVAKVPGMRINRQPVVITIKEFNELSRSLSNGKET